MSTANKKSNSTASMNKQKMKATSSLTNRGLLVALSSNLFGKTFIVDKSKVVIGRSSNCDFVINDPLVSSEHCTLIFEKDNKFYINDLDSKNFTYLNDKKIKKLTHIIYGDRIVIGNTIIRFYLEEKIDN